MRENPTFKLAERASIPACMQSLTLRTSLGPWAPPQRRQPQRALLGWSGLHRVVLVPAVVLRQFGGVDRVRQGHLARDAVLVCVSEVLVLETEKIPLKPSERLEHGKDPSAHVRHWSGRGQVDDPAESDEGVGDDGEIVGLELG